MYLQPLRIGSVTLENNMILAPMAGITDLPFRMLAKKQGPGLVVTEMISSKAIFYGDEKTKKLMKVSEKERPVAVQIFGSDVQTMRFAAKEVSKFADIIDINMGCPAPKVVKNGDGSKLLLNLKLAEEIVKAVVEEASVPVTVKIRKGWDQDHIVAVEAARAIERAGASAITIHGRTRDEFYSGKADWDCIRQVKETVSIPVIGNGDITDAITAEEMFRKTGVDGIMIGRAAMGNPWIFREISTYLQTGKKAEPISLEEKLAVILEHIEKEVEEKGEQIAIKEMRKHIAWYSKNLKESTKLREKINQMVTKKEMTDCLIEYFHFLSNID